MSISTLQQIIVNAGGTPGATENKFTYVGLVRELIKTTGHTPTKFNLTHLLRELVSAVGGTPTKYDDLGLLRQLVQALGGTPATFRIDALWEQVRTLGIAGGGALTKLVIEGDSISSTSPDTPDSNFYSYQYKTARPDKTVYVRAQGSRSVGEPANLNDNSNTLWGNRDEDRAYDPDILTCMLGANELHLTPKTMQQWYDDYLLCLTPARTDGAKIGLAVPLPFGSAHSSYVTFNSRRDALAPIMAAGVGVGFDFIIPFDEHPVLGDRSLWLNNTLATDGVHPTASTQLLMAAVYAAAVNPVFDSATGNTPTGTFFGSNVSDADTTGSTVRTYIVTGMGPGVSASFSATGTGVTWKRGADAYGTSAVTVRNGSVVSLKIDHSDQYATRRTASWTLGGASGSWWVETLAQPVLPTAPTPTFRQSGNLNYGAATSGILNNVPIGPPDSSRLVYYFSYIDYATGATNVKFNGVNGTKLLQGSNASLWVGSVPTGTTCTIEEVSSFDSKSSYIVLTGQAAPNVVGTPATGGYNYQAMPVTSPAFTLAANQMELIFLLYERGAGTPAWTGATGAGYAFSTQIAVGIMAAFRTATGSGVTASVDGLTGGGSGHQFFLATYGQ